MLRCNTLRTEWIGVPCSLATVTHNYVLTFVSAWQGSACVLQCGVTRGGLLEALPRQLALHCATTAAACQGGCSRLRGYLLTATRTIASRSSTMRYFRNSENLIRPPPLVRTPIRIESGLSGQGEQTRPASGFHCSIKYVHVFVLVLMEPNPTRIQILRAFDGVAGPLHTSFEVARHLRKKLT